MSADGEFWNVERLDHISFTVGELERSIAFYRRFGFELVKRYVSAGPDVDEGAATANAAMDIAWLGRPSGSVMMELIRYVHHPVEPAALNSRVGAAHLCFAVDGVQAAYQQLRADGIEFLSAPHQDAFGMRWVYLRDPDGNTVELIQDPPISP